MAAGRSAAAKAKRTEELATEDGLFRPEVLQGDRHQPGPNITGAAQPATLQRAGVADTALGAVTSKLLAQAAAFVEQIPDESFGPLINLAKAGLLGFIKKLAAVPATKLIKMARKVFQALKSPSYVLGFLLGLLKGFFVDGLAGIFILIYDLAKLAVELPQLGVKLAQRLGQRALSALAGEIGALGQWLSANAPVVAAALLQELSGKGGLSGAVAQIVAYLMSKAKGVATQFGGKMAAGLMNFLGKSKAAVGRALGAVAGRLSGAALFEILLTVATSGGGAALSAVKTGLRATLGLLGKVGRGFMKVLAPLGKLLGKAVSALKGWIGALANAKATKELGAKLSALFSKLGKFIKSILGRSTQSGKPGTATTGGRAAAAGEGLPAPASLPKGARTTTEGLPSPASLPRSGLVKYSWTDKVKARSFAEHWMVNLGGKVLEYPNHRAFVDYWRRLSGKASDIPVAFVNGKGELVLDTTRLDIPRSWYILKNQAQNRRRAGLL
ncbi:MAG: hypothetical protein R3300_16015 [Candidatus Promineifilaceae bacterium]|nr:hypothetical protein [Candidatus Promineifilaceae bacterium]